MGTRFVVGFCCIHRFSGNNSVVTCVPGGEFANKSKRIVKLHFFSCMKFNCSCFQIRTIGLAICVFALNCTSFACAKLFPILIEKIGMHGCMIIFAVNCIIGSFFMFFILNETRGKAMDTLQSENTHTVTP